MKKYFTVIVLLFTSYFASSMYKEVKYSIQFNNIPGHIEDYIDTLEQTLLQIGSDYTYKFNKIDSKTVNLVFITIKKLPIDDDVIALDSLPLTIPRFVPESAVVYYPYAVISSAQDCHRMKHILQTLNKYLPIIDYKETGQCNWIRGIFGLNNFTATFKVARALEFFTFKGISPKETIHKKNKQLYMSMKENLPDLESELKKKEE